MSDTYEYDVNDIIIFIYKLIYLVLFCLIVIAQFRASPSQIDSYSFLSGLLQINRYNCIWSRVCYNETVTIIFGVGSVTYKPLLFVITFKTYIF